MKIKDDLGYEIEIGDFKIGQEVKIFELKGRIKKFFLDSDGCVSAFVTINTHGPYKGLSYSFLLNLLKEM